MKKQFYFILMLLSSYVSAWAVNVEGVVYDEKSEPVIGATITVKESKSSSITDLKGRFKLNVEDPKKAMLIVSFIGYKKKYMQLEGKTMVTVFLEPNDVSLDEVVVIGYGQSRKSDLTGSLSSVKPTQEDAMANTSFDKMLQGKAAGVTVTTSSNAPGGAVEIRVRGTSSLRGNNSPLYVVDGTVIETDQNIDPMGQGTQSGNSLSAPQNPLSAISPQDIQNIEILKDASATAIYGSRGANGVVLITTKQGTSGKPTVTFSSTFTSSRMVNKVDMLNTAEYVDFYNTMNPATPLTLATLTPVNWQDYCTRDAFSQNYRANVSAKTGKSSYYLSAGYMNNQGIIKKTGTNQFDLRLNLTQEINKSVSLSTNTMMSNLRTTMTSGTDKLSSTKSSIITHMIMYRPYTNGDIAASFDENLTGPDAWFKDYDDDSNDTHLSTNAVLNINLLKWLKLQLKQAVDYRSKDRSMWYGTSVFVGAQSNGKAGISTLKSFTNNSQALLQFDKKIGKIHTLSGTMGVEYNNKSFATSVQTGENFTSKSLRAKGISLAQTLYPYLYDESGEQLFSALGRVVYNLKDKYVFTGTFRADGSSKFTGNNKFSYFPSFAAAWRIKEEEFLKNVESISNLKLRMGWGQVGNQAIKPYQTLQSYYNNSYTSADGSLIVGLSPQRIPNPNLKWETSEQYNVGLDLGLLDQRLSFTVDVFKKQTKDLLQETSLSGSSGYTSMWINNGIVENRGAEFTVDANVIKSKNFRLSVGGNISLVRNKILDLGMPMSDFGVLKGVSGYLGDNLGNNNNTKFSPNIFLVGHSVGQFFGYQTDGILQAGETQTFNGTTLSEGNIRVKDLSGNGIVNEEDRTILGNPNPDFTYAFNLNMDYKNWTLNMAFNGVQGNDIINANLIDQSDVSNAIRNISHQAYYNAWNATTNPTGTYPKLGTAPLGVLTDRMIEDGSYLRMSSLTLSYRLKLPKLNLFNSLTFSGTVNNVFCLTNYSGYDPDVNSFSGDTDRMGVDLASYPASRSFIFGLTANF